MNIRRSGLLGRPKDIHQRVKADAGLRLCRSHSVTARMIIRGQTAARKLKLASSCRSGRVKR